MANKLLQKLSYRREYMHSYGIMTLTDNHNIALRLWNLTISFLSSNQEVHNTQDTEQATWENGLQRNDSDAIVVIVWFITWAWASQLTMVSH